MDKQALLSLPLPGLPKSRREAVYRTESVQYILRSAVSKGILVVAFYNRQSAANGFSLPTGVLYMGKDSYKTQVTFDGKAIWRDSRVRCALRCSGHLENVCLTKTDEHRIYKYL